VSGRFFKNNLVSKVFYNFLGAVKKYLTIFFFLILEARVSWISIVSACLKADELRNRATTFIPITQINFNLQMLKSLQKGVKNEETS